MDTDNVKNIGTTDTAVTNDIALGLGVFFKKQGWLVEASSGGFKFNLPTTIAEIPTGNVYASLQTAGAAILPVVRSYAAKGAAAA